MMSIREICKQVETVDKTFTAVLSSMENEGLREDLTAELREIENAEIAAGRTEAAARSSSWKRVKMLHALGYPIDFDWLHRPAEAKQ